MNNRQDHNAPRHRASEQLVREDRALFRLDNILLIGLPLLVLLGLGLWYVVNALQPTPPRSIVISTGSPDGGYYAFGEAYRTILARSGIRLRIRTSHGSIENLARLKNPGSDISVAFVQGGVADASDTPGLLSLGRIFHEPLWVFYTGGTTITTMPQLRTKRLAIGERGSGTRALVLSVLNIGKMSVGDVTALPIGGQEAADALRQGKVDAAFFVASIRSRQVRDLLADPNIKLMSFAHAKAYERLLPYVSRLELPRGVIDISINLPANDIQLIAPAAALLVRRDMHSALASLLAETAAKVHGGAGLFQKPGDFPKSRDPVYEMSSDATRIYTSGVPFLRQYLPFWMVVWIHRLVVMLVPLLTIVLPIMKFAPLLYKWQTRRKILRWYVHLQALERRACADIDAQEHTDLLAQLDAIDAAVADIKVPMQYSDELFALRDHIDHARERMMARGAAPKADKSGLSKASATLSPLLLPQNND